MTRRAVPENPSNRAGRPDIPRRLGTNRGPRSSPTTELRMRRTASTRLAVALAGALSIAAGCSVMRPLAKIGPLQEQQFVMDRDDALDATVHLSYWSGRLRVRPGDAARAARLHTRDNLDEVDAHADARRTGEHLEVRLWLDSDDSLINFRSWQAEERAPDAIDPKSTVINEWDLELAEGMPLALDCELAACDADLDLGGLLLRRAKIEIGGGHLVVDFAKPQEGRLERLEFDCGAGNLVARRIGNAHARTILVDVGAGSCELDLSGEWKEDALVHVDSGAANVEIRVPRGLAVRVDLKDKVFAEFSARDFRSEGDKRYTSPDWGMGGPSIVVEVEATLGHVGFGITQ